MRALGPRAAVLEMIQRFLGTAAIVRVQILEFLFRKCVEIDPAFYRQRVRRQPT